MVVSILTLLEGVTINYFQDVKRLAMAATSKTNLTYRLILIFTPDSVNQFNIPLTLISRVLEKNLELLFKTILHHDALS